MLLEEVTEHFWSAYTNIEWRAWPIDWKIDVSKRRVGKKMNLEGKWTPYKIGEPEEKEK